MIATILAVTTLKDGVKQFIQYWAHNSACTNDPINYITIIAIAECRNEYLSPYSLAGLVIIFLFLLMNEIGLHFPFGN